MKKFIAAAIAWAALAAPALAEQYNIVCPITVMGTAQVGSATVQQGYIFSVDLDAGRACMRPNGKCGDLIVMDNATALPNDGMRTFEYNVVTDQLTVLSPDAMLQAGVCRRAPFQALPPE